MASTPRERKAPPELAVAALVVAASLPLARLFTGDGLGSTVAIALILGTSVSWIGRRMRLSPALVWCFSVLALIWYISVRYFPDTLFGVFPTGETFGELGDAIRKGAKLIYEEAVPVKVTPELMLFVTAGVWMSCWLVATSAISLGSPLLGVASAFPLFLLAGALEPSRRLWFDAGAFIAASAWLVYQGERTRAGAMARSPRAGWRAWTASWVALLAMIGALVIAPQLPGFGAQPWLRERGPGNRVTFNPFVAIKPTLDSKEERILFTVETKRPTYYRLTSVEQFDGKIFKPARRTEIAQRFWLPESPRWPSVRQVFSINALGGAWLPASYRPLHIDAPRPVFVEQETDAFVAPELLQPQTRYAVISDVPRLTPQMLDTSVVYDREALKSYLDLPRLPREIREIARRIVAEEATVYGQAVALQNHLRTFTYDEDVASKFSYDDIETFLTRVKRGYCEQFAVSMTVLARALGIPARIALGFAKGDAIGKDLYSVTTRDAHAWVEIYFPQAGWVSFEPTPRGGFARPAYAVGEDGSTSDPARPDPQDSVSAEPSAAPSNRLPPDDPAAPDLVEAPAGVPRWIGVGGVLVLLLLVPFGLAGIFALRRRARLARATGTRERVGLTYADFLGWCAAAGLGRAPGETPSEHAARAGEAAPPAAEPLGRLAVMVDEALYAPPNGLDPGEAGRVALQARAAIAEGLPRRKRLLAALGWGRRAAR